MQTLGGQLLGIAFNDEEMRPCRLTRGLYGAALRRGFLPGRRHRERLSPSLERKRHKGLVLVFLDPRVEVAAVEMDAPAYADHR